MVTDVIAFKSFKNWIRASREQERRRPERYLSHYSDTVTCDDEYAWMTQETLDKIKRHCGQYNLTFPTGDYCGKMFLQDHYLVWYGISKENPRSYVKLNYREIRLIDE